MDKKIKRIWEIDFLRGVALLFMVIDHFIYNFYSYPDTFKWKLRAGELFTEFKYFANFYWKNIKKFELLGTSLHYYFVILFILISGISTTFSRSSLKRSLQILVGAYLVSIFTCIFAGSFGPGFEIPFGILHTIGFSMLIYSLIDLKFKSKYISLAIGLIVIGFGYSIPHIGLKMVEVKTNSMFVKEFYLAIIGLGRLPSADYFGMVPWLGYFMIGTFLGKTLYKEKVSRVPNLDGKYASMFKFLGRNSIWVYLTHQVILFVLFIAIAYLFGYRIPL